MSAKVTDYELNCETIYYLIFKTAKPYANSACILVAEWSEIFRYTGSIFFPFRTGKLGQEYIRGDFNEEFEENKVFTLKNFE